MSQKWAMPKLLRPLNRELSCAVLIWTHKGGERSPNLCTEICLAPRLTWTQWRSSTHKQGEQNYKNLKPAAVQIWATHHYNMPSWPLSSGSCCILVPHCSWWFWRPVEWVPDSCMTVTSTPLHVHPHGLQQWGLEMKHVSNLILRSMAGVWEWD